MSRRVTLKTTETHTYEWDLNVPDHIDADNGDEVYDWANEHELLEFDVYEIEERESHIEIADDAMKKVRISYSETVDHSWVIDVPAHFEIRKDDQDIFEWADNENLLSMKDGDMVDSHLCIEDIK